MRKQKRSSYPYRKKYFEKNPGLLGFIWICSQCGKPLFGKSSVAVDHIIPLDKGGKNHVSNCTSICKHCNSSKGAKVDIRIVKGYFSKWIFSLLMAVQSFIVAILKLPLIPICQGSVFTRLLFTALYTYILYILLKEGIYFDW